MRANLSAIRFAPFLLFAWSGIAVRSRLESLFALRRNRYSIWSAKRNRHIIFHLLRKPGAFRNYQFREELFPRTVFRRAYDALLAHDDEKADKEYLRILNAATLEGEDKVAGAIELLLQANALPRSERIQNLCKSEKQIPTIHVDAPSLKGYDDLLHAKLTGENQ